MLLEFTSVGYTFRTFAVWSLSETIGRPIETLSYHTLYSRELIVFQILIRDTMHVLVSLLPQPRCPLSAPSSPFPSNTTRSPMSLIPRLSRPLPSPSPFGRPESSKRALKDSNIGVTNSFSIGTACPSLGGFLNVCSLRSVSNVEGDIRGLPSGIVGQPLWQTACRTELMVSRMYEN